MLGDDVVAKTGGAAESDDLPQAVWDFVTGGWKAEEPTPESPHPAAANFARRRADLARHFPGQTLVIPTGTIRERNPSDDYRFRPGSDFYYLTGSKEPDGVLIIQPTATGPESTLYVMPRSDNSTVAYFKDTKYGEMWIPPRPGLAETATHLGVITAPLDSVQNVLRNLDKRHTVVLAGVDSSVDGAFARHWWSRGRRSSAAKSAELSQEIARLREFKDPFEVSELQRAVDASKKGFDAVIATLPQAEAIPNGERLVEGTFNSVARTEGNDVGYQTIAADGRHATTLHWTRNDGPVRSGDLLLLDAGVEGDELYTADVTRTLPVSGTFTKEQREVYDIVLEAQKAGIAAAQPGADFLAPTVAARKVLAAGLKRLGIPSTAMPPDVEVDDGFVMRYKPHGVSHMLGLDVHDGDVIRKEYKHGKLQPGQVFTVEPGLYFKLNDPSVPAEYRGIGVRIEDDILITDSGNVNLTAAIPKEADAVEAWVRQGRGEPAVPKAAPDRGDHGVSV